MGGPIQRTETTSDAASGDAGPNRILRAYAWVLAHWPNAVRWRIAVVVVSIVFVLAAIPMLARVAGIVIDLGVLPYLALVILCWLGEGGALVPVPGVRMLSWITIVQQGANLDPVLVAVLAALAMAAGQTSYFAAARYGGRFASGRISRFAHLQVPGSVPQASEDTTLADGPSEADVEIPIEGGRSRRLMQGGRERLVRASTAVAARMRSHPCGTILAVSILPSPLTTLATLTAATVGISFPRYVVPLATGFLVFATVLVLAGQGLFAVLDI
jgi:hypothetical protein